MPRSKKPRKQMNPRKILDKKAIGYPTYTPIEKDEQPFSTKSSRYTINFKTK